MNWVVLIQQTIDTREEKKKIQAKLKLHFLDSKDTYILQLHSSFFHKAYKHIRSTDNSTKTETGKKCFKMLVGQLNVIKSVLRMSQTLLRNLDKNN